MENETKGNYNPEDRNSETRQAGTNRDNSVVNKPTTDESGTASNRNDQYNAGGTDRLTGTTSVSDARNAENSRESSATDRQSFETDDTEDENLQAGQNEFDSENLDDENSDDFLRGSGRDNGEEDRSFKNNPLDPDFDRNTEV